MFFDSPKKENKNNDIKNTLYSEDKKYNTEKKNNVKRDQGIHLC